MRSLEALQPATAPCCSAARVTGRRTSSRREPRTPRPRPHAHAARALPPHRPGGDVRRRARPTSSTRTCRSRARRRAMDAYVRWFARRASRSRSPSSASSASSTGHRSQVLAPAPAPAIEGSPNLCRARREGLAFASTTCARSASCSPARGRPLDAHPLVREHFAGRLRAIAKHGGRHTSASTASCGKRGRPAATLERCSRSSPRWPTGEAGLHDEVLQQVYWRGSAEEGGLPDPQARRVRADLAAIAASS